MNRTGPLSRRLALGGLAALGAGGGAWAQTQQLQAQPPKAQPPLVPVPAPPQAPEAPPDGGAQLEGAFDGAERMAVPVFLNGQGPFPFVVDTGANSSVISLEVADRCGLPRVGTAPVHGILAAEQAPLVKVARFQVGDVRSNNLRLPLLDGDMLGAGGLLGLDMLHGRRITLDFAHRSFDIAPSSDGPGMGRERNSRIPDALAPVAVAARFRSGQLIIIDASVGGRTVTAFLDSGSQVTVANRALRSLVVSDQPRVGEAMIHSTLISATGQKADADFGPLPGLRIGRISLAPRLVAFADLHIFRLWNLLQTPSLLVGVDLLRYFDKVAFDYGHKELTFWPPAHPRVERG